MPQHEVDNADTLIRFENRHLDIDSLQRTFLKEEKRF